MFPLDDPPHSPAFLAGPALLDPVLLGVLTAAVEEESVAAYEAGFTDGLREARFREARFRETRSGGVPAAAGGEDGPPGDEASGGPPPVERLWTPVRSGDDRAAQ